MPSPPQQLFATVAAERDALALADPHSNGVVVGGGGGGRDLSELSEEMQRIAAMARDERQDAIEAVVMKTIDRVLGRAVHVNPIKPTLKPPGTKRLKP